MAEFPVENLKRRCHDFVYDFDHNKDLEQEKFLLMNEIYAAIMWHEQSKYPGRTHEELEYWLAKDLQLDEFPVML
jgi:hypothetical protein